MTAGLNRKQVVKFKARVMLQRNIDISLSQVNGSLDTIEQVIWDIDNHSVIHKLRIKFLHSLDYDFISRTILRKICIFRIKNFNLEFNFHINSRLP